MSKRIELGSDEYLASFKENLNTDEDYAKLASSVVDSYTLVLQAEPDKGVEDTLVVGFEIKEGRMTDIWLGEKETSFILSAPYRVWVDILIGNIGANRAFITRKLRIKGNMPRLLKTAKATDRLVEILREMPTRFHGEYDRHSFG
ncbi:MAG: SCP2 sterol-binding domain-containing protein [Candidatus Thorarchaeota archaeon]|nr:MAG: SCP2 sterol-binding domain-containing protein [Candidatus Thorarchaeota archaeon]